MARSVTAATIRRRMAQGEKPYRVYRGGRVKGVCRPSAKPERAPARTQRPPHRFKGPGPKAPGPKRQRNWGRWIAIGISAFLVLVLVWGVASYLSLRSGVKAANKRLPRIGEGGARSAERAAALEPERDPAARHRPLLEDPGPEQLRALGLDHAAPHRPGQAAPELPLDPARPPGQRSPATATTRSTRRTRSAAPALAIKTVRGFTGVAGQPRRDRRLRRLQEADRQGRRRRHRRAEADPLEQVRLPLRDPGALRPLAGLALREGHAAHERPARARLLADPREPAQPARERHHAHRAPAAGASRRCSRS